MLSHRRLLAPGLLASLGVASLLAAGTAGAQPDAGAAPAGIKAAGECVLHTFNRDVAQPATVVVDFYKQGGLPAVAINLPPIPPVSDYVTDLAIESKLTDGAYAAIVSGDRDLGNLTYCQWPASGGAGAMNQSAPSTSVTIPLLVKGYGGRSSLVSIQNTDSTLQTSVTVKLYQSGGSVPMITKQYAIEKGTSITMDLANNLDFMLLPNGFAGYLTAESATPLAVNAWMDYENSEKAVAAFEGVPAEEAAAGLDAPLVARAADLVPGTTGAATVDSAIAVVNPGGTDASVAIAYTGTGGTCAGQSFNHPAFPLPAGTGAVFYQGDDGTAAPTGTSGLPAGCTATARVTATGGQVVGTVVLEAHLPATPKVALYAAAYNAMPAAMASRTVDLPYLRRGQDASTSAVWVMNTGSGPATATLALTEAGPPARTVNCGAGCSASIPPGEAHLWWLRDIADFGDGLAGWATVTGDQPLAVAVLDVPVGGGKDLSAYVGLAEDPAAPQFRPGFAPLLMMDRGFARPTNTPRPTALPATSTPVLPTATLVPPSTATPLPTATPMPLPSPTPLVQGMAPNLPDRVPPAVLADALANPSGIQGWQQPLDPGKPVGPYNPLRTCLTLRNPAVPWHPLFNSLIFRAGCP